jgi:hypothetical protein
MTARRRTPISRIALPLAATLIVLSAPAPVASATRHMTGAPRDREVLQEQVVRLFDRLDHVSLVVESVRVKMALIEDRLSDLSRQIDSRQELLNRRAAEAYMAGRAGGIESVLGADSFTDLGDALAFLDAVSQEDHDLLLSLRRRKADLELDQRRLGALEEDLRRKREWLEATALDLVEELQRQHALLGRSDATAPDASVVRSSAPSPLPSPSPPSSAPGREVVTHLIRDRFASLGTATTGIALCVAEAESGFDPLAVNPTTGAAGVYQFLPTTWESLSELAGRTGASVFDVRANVAVAAWTVAHYGWHPWRSVAAACGA